MDYLFNLAAQSWRKGDPNPTPRPAVPYMPLRYFNTEHFFEAQRLSAELQVSRRPMLDTRFVFDRTNRAPFDLDRIGAA